MSHLSASASEGHGARQDARNETAPRGAVIDLHQRAADIVRRLDVAGRRVLVEAARPVLLNAPEPYLPSLPEDAHLAHWLTQPPLGLLVSEWVGYAMVYRLTYLGRLVVSGFLTDYLLRLVVEPLETGEVEEAVRAREGGEGGEGGSGNEH